jgi:hypothetical protein
MPRKTQTVKFDERMTYYLDKYCRQSRTPKEQLSMNRTRKIFVFAAALLLPAFAYADTLMTSGSSNVSVTPTNMYAYCVGDPICGVPNIYPSAKTDNVTFDITLAGLAVPQGFSLTSATLSFSGLDLGSFSQVDDQATLDADTWNVNTGAGNFTSMTVGSYSVALSGTDGSVSISDPNALAALAAGDPINLQGYAAVTTSPTSGKQNDVPVINFDIGCLCITAEAIAYSSLPVFDTQYYSPAAEVDGVTAAAAAPEPSSLLLLASGCGLLLGLTIASKHGRISSFARPANRFSMGSSPKA